MLQTQSIEQAAVVSKVALLDALTPSRVLTTPAERALLIERFNATIGGIAYRSGDFDGMDVRGFFRRGELVAGYAVNTEPPYYYVEHIPEDERTAPPFQQSRPATFAEVRGLWIDRSVSNLIRARVYCRSVLDCAAKRPDYIVGGSPVPGARRTMRRAVPHLLWEGNYGEWGGKDVDSMFFYGTPTECVLRLPYAVVGGLYARLRKGR